jgi:hypothetical protein
MPLATLVCQTCKITVIDQNQVFQNGVTFAMEQTTSTHLWIFSLGRWYVFSAFYTTTTSSCQSCTLRFRGPNNCGKCILLIAIFNIYTSFVTWVCFNLTCYFGSFRFCLSEIRKFNMLKMCNSESSYFSWYAG